ncbi:glycosyl hydrolase [Cohnella thailandensis]|uniref:Alpha-L-rhamnosidase n=1 Tax=Cohnella thailandensis TaxID=557557 RepID=A0A841SWW6_9BACL|nr:glycosyl hydrolase [Cohnella thailandensis]MBB6634625.1 hypothetical protein [Cohnella thailandensis]MBP1972819.1 hypothetical protein [Cohnella thailandensis]
MTTWQMEYFRSPSKRFRPRMRWWLPGAFMENEEIKREIEWMAEAGYGGAEIIHFFQIPNVEVKPSDYGRYGFGGPEWNDRMKAALEAAIPLNFQLDFTIGPLWPIATPAIMDKNDERCAQGLHVGTIIVTGSYSGEIPVPATIDPERNYKLTAVTAARQVEGGETVGNLKTLELETAVDLTHKTRGKRIEWTAPDSGKWCLFGFWSQTNGQMNDSIGAPVIDHYSKASADAVTGFWEEHLFADPYIQSLYEKNAGNLFCDSIELNATMQGGMYGATPMAVAIWSPSVLEEFRARRGYDLTPFLPAIFVKGLYQLGAGNRTDGNSEYDFAEREANGRIRNDFFTTLTELFRDNHLRTLRLWANGHNMKLRYQTYGMTTELTSGLAEVDIPETESLGFRDSTDGYRLQSGAVHLYEREIYSIEVGAVMGYGYKQTWTGHDFGLLWQLHRGFSAGVNQAVLHGMSYETASASGHFEAMFKWPGMSLMGSMFSNEWGTRQPTSRHARALTDYIARSQYVLQQGKPKVDLAIYRHHIDGIHEGMGTELTPYELAGYTYDFISPCLLETPSAKVGEFNGQPALAADGPAYRAIIVDMRKNTVSGDWMSSDLPVETAERLIALASEGLPIVLVGNIPCRVVSYPGSIADLKIQESRLQERIAVLLDRRTVRLVPDQAHVFEALAQLNVVPAVQFRSGLPLLSARRNQIGCQYYFLYNPSCDETYDGEVLLEGRGVPVRLNAWDGSANPIAANLFPLGRAGVKLRLAPNESALFAILEEWPEGDGLESPKPSGTGKHVVMDCWSLEVEGWSPGDQPTSTKLEHIEVELDELRSWTELPELRSVSGIGRYRTELRLEAHGGNRNSVILDLGEVSDTFRVFVNGRGIQGANQIGRRIQIGEYIQFEGVNTLEIEVATTLNNALMASDPNRKPQECGLMGPVTIYYNI